MEPIEHNRAAVFMQVEALSCVWRGSFDQWAVLQEAIEVGAVISLIVCRWKYVGNSINTAI